MGRAGGCRLIDRDRGLSLLLGPFVVTRWNLPALIIPLCVGCATPVAPTGGPVDETPPSLVDMYPPSNSVDFGGDRIRFEFSEPVDRASFERALTIVPELTPSPQLRWKGSRLEMVFLEPLPSATTFVFTIDNDLRDERGVAIKSPIVRAIATGSAIDEGSIVGRLLDAATGAPVPNIDVIATRVDTMGETEVRAPGYRTQSGADGKFVFEFLPDAPFFALAFEDRNRNRVRDAGEKYAVPPVPELVPVPKGSTRTEIDWWIVNPDTSRPTVTEVRSRSSRRTELRYSEPVRLDSLTPSAWVLRDTLSARSIQARELYRHPSDSRRIVLVTDSLPESTYRVATFGLVSDTAGNAARTAAPSFDVRARPDTLSLRFLGFSPSATDTTLPIPLTARRPLEVRFNQYVHPERLVSMIAVSDTAGVARPFTLLSDDGVTWQLVPSPPTRPGEIVRVTVATDGPGMTEAGSAEFRRLGLDETGSLSGHVASDEVSIGAMLVVEVYSEQKKLIRLVAKQRTTGDYLVGDLPSGGYKLRAYVDRDGDGKWSWGRIDPYLAPEPLTWYPDSARVRSSWETVLDTLRIDTPSSQ